VAALIRVATNRELLLAMTEHNRSVAPMETWPHVLAAVSAAYVAAGA